MADMYEYDYPLNTYGLIISHATLHHGKKKNVLTLLNKIYDALVKKEKYLSHYRMRIAKRIGQ